MLWSPYGFRVDYTAQLMFKKARELLYKQWVQYIDALR